MLAKSPTGMIQTWKINIKWYLLLGLETHIKEILECQDEHKLIIQIFEIRDDYVGTHQPISTKLPSLDEVYHGEPFSIDHFKFSVVA